MCKKIRTRRLILHMDRPFRGDGSDLRRAVTGVFPDNPVLHNHAREGCKYGAPLVRFLVQDGLPQMMAVGDGVPVLESIRDEIATLRVFSQVYQVTGWDMHDCLSTYGMAGHELVYGFLSPWLALNEMNYRKYIRSGSPEKRKILLGTILVGNIISMSKGFQYSVPDRVNARIIFTDEVETKLKGTPFLGFVGAFSANFEIPDYWGIGKSVSRGFGTIKRMD